MEDHDDQDIEIIYSDGEDENVVQLLEQLDGDVEFDQEANTSIDLSKLNFTQHSRPVFCCDLSPDGQLAVTGGEDDSAYVWSTSDATVVLECTGHKDSVTSVCFNHDGQLLATGDMAGLIQVWNVKEKKLIWCYEEDDMEWLLFHPIANVLLSGTQSGDVYIWQVPQGNCKVLPSHGASCTAGKVLPGGKNLLTGYSDGELKLWDIKSSSVLWSFKDSQGIISIDVNSLGTLVSIAPSSVVLKIIDGKPLGTLLSGGEEGIEAHVFNTDLNVLVTGSLTGQLSVWDVPKQAIRHQANIGSAVTVMKLGLHGNVFVGGADGNVYVCDMKTGTLKQTLTGHMAEILGICVFPDSSAILTTSEDKTAKVFSIQC